MQKAVFNIAHKIEQGLSTIIWAIIGMVLIWMTIVCGNSSARVDYVERSYIIQDNFYMQLLASFAVLGLLSISYYVYSLCKGQFNDEWWQKSYFIVRNAVLIVVLVTGLLFVLAAQKAPRADQYAVVSFAYSFRNGDFSGLNPGGYMDLYHNQFGIVILLYYLSFIFGDYNYIAIQILNTIALTITYWALSCILESKFGKKIAVLFLIIAMLFLPAELYLTFVYGTIIGLMFCAISFLFMLRFMDTNKWSYLWLTGVLSVLAIFVKQNYLIFTIGMLAFCFFEILRGVNKKTIIATMVIIITMAIGSLFPTIIVEKMSSTDIDGGVSSWSFIAMGLQDSDLLYDGWYNRYNVDVYESVGFNTEELTRISKEYIQSRLTEFSNDLGEGISFFSRKNASQWMNPDFQGFWINWVMSGANHDLQTARWLEALFSIYASEWIYVSLNVLQFLIFLGTVFYVIIGKKNNVSLYFALIFLGGVVFHTFWEAKSQYTLPYFIYIIPLAAMGWIDLTRICVETIKEAKTAGILNKINYSKRHILAVATLLIGFILLVIVQSKKVDIINRLFVFDQYNDLEYYKFVNDNTSKRFDRGRYNIVSAVDESVISGIGDSVAVSSAGTEDDFFEIESYGDYTLLRFSNTNMYLDVPEGIAEEGKVIQLFAGNNSIAQRWRIADAGNGMVYIYYEGDENYLLSSDSQTGQVFLSKQNNVNNQKWFINKPTY